MAASYPSRARRTQAVVVGSGKRGGMGRRQIAEPAAGVSAHDRFQTLLEATQRLSESIDYDRTLENIVRFVAERFASYAILDLVAEDGHVERVAVAHRDPARAPLVEAMRRFDPPVDSVATHPVARAIVSSEPSIQHVDDAWISRCAISPAHAAAMRALEMRTLLAVPVTNGRHVVGALSCVLDRRGEAADFDAADVAFAVELGRRAGIAIDNARLYEHQRLIAFTLQQASLPRRLPASEDLLLDAFYRPARREAEIGGDWYDAFALDDGRIALTLGDVVGKGLLAAVTMGRVRQAMQAAAFMTGRPDAMLQVADWTLRLEDDARYATGLAAIYDPAERGFELCAAGHAPPIVCRADGSIEHADVAGTMLGIGAPAGGDPIARLSLAPGESLVFFTDGLTEIDRDIEAGEARLAAELMRPELLRSARSARAIVDAVIGRRTATDDVAVLVATMR